MAVVDLDILIQSGVINTANGVFMTNNKADNDPRKAVIFDSKQDALDSIEQSTFFNRVEGLRLPVRENGNIVEYIFDGGIADENFIILNQGLWEIVQENPYNLKVPTEAEWIEEKNTWTSNNYNGAFNSILKLSLAGRRGNTSGEIQNVGLFANYHSSTLLFDINYPPFRLELSASNARLVVGLRATGYSIRLITEGIFTQQNYDDDYENETIIINGLQYGFVYNPTTQRIWLDRNLGATQVATSLTDSNAYGDLFQWGRDADGHEKRNSNTTNIQATTPQPNHSDFIVSFHDWLTPSNNDLWQGVFGENNPAYLGEKLIGKDNKQASYNDLKDKPVVNVELDSELLDPTKLQNIYKGIIVYSEESEIHYKWNGLDRTNASNWIGINSTIEPINEGNGIGYRLRGRNPDNYGNIGENAIDLSDSTSASTTRGATGQQSFCAGINNTASGFHSVALGSNNISSSSRAFTAGNSNQATAQSSFALGGSVFARSDYEFSIGKDGTDYTPANDLTDRIFNVAIGLNSGDRKDGLTLFKNGALKIWKAALASITNAMAGMLIFNSDDNNRPYIHNGIDWNGLAYKLKEYTVATLPATPTAGEEAIVTDGDTVSYRAVATGGGTEYVKVFYDGTNWRYI